MSETPQPTYHWIYYAISNIAACLVSIDCAINAWAYMSIMHGWLACLPAIIICACAGFILNFILYQKDTPEALENLWQQIQRLHTLSWSEILSTVIALASGLTMALFTYQSYLSLGLSFVSPLIAIVFSTAYAIGTFALAMPNTPNAQPSPNSDRKSNNNIDVMLWTILLSILMLLTIHTFYHEIFILLSGLVPHAGILTGCLVSLFALGECNFNYKVATYFVTEIIPDIQAIQTNNNMLIFLLLMTLAMLNALGNGAITANGGSYIIAILGALLSLFVMTREATDLSSTQVSIDQAKYNGIMAALYLSLPLIAVWIMNTVILPLHYNTVFAPTFVVLLLTAMCVVSLVATCEYSLITEQDMSLPAETLESKKQLGSDYRSTILPFFCSVLSPT